MRQAQAPGQILIKSSPCCPQPMMTMLHNRRLGLALVQTLPARAPTRHQSAIPSQHRRHTLASLLILHPQKTHPQKTAKLLLQARGYDFVQAARPPTQTVLSTQTMRSNRSCSTRSHSMLTTAILVSRQIQCLYKGLGTAVIVQPCPQRAAYMATITARETWMSGTLTTQCTGTQTPHQHLGHDRKVSTRRDQTRHQDSVACSILML